MQAVWMLLSAAFFAGMGVCVKFASQHFNASELVFYRGVISVVIMLAMLRGRDIEWRTQMPGQHLWRSAVGVFSLVTWFYALAELPLATAMTLNYMSSVWVALMALIATLWWRLRGSGVRPALAQKRPPSLAPGTEHHGQFHRRGVDAAPHRRQQPMVCRSGRFGLWAGRRPGLFAGAHPDPCR